MFVPLRSGGEFTERACRGIAEIGELALLFFPNEAALGGPHARTGPATLHPIRVGRIRGEPSPPTPEAVCDAFAQQLQNHAKEIREPLLQPYPSPSGSR
jgi:hypothetical protein